MYLPILAMCLVRIFKTLILLQMWLTNLKLWVGWGWGWGEGGFGGSNTLSVFIRLYLVWHIRLSLLLIVMAYNQKKKKEKRFFMRFSACFVCNLCNVLLFYVVGTVFVIIICCFLFGTALNYCSRSEDLLKTIYLLLYTLLSPNHSIGPHRLCYFCCRYFMLFFVRNCFELLFLDPSSIENNLSTLSILHYWTTPTMLLLSICKSYVTSSWSEGLFLL